MPSDVTSLPTFAGKARPHHQRFPHVTLAEVLNPTGPRTPSAQIRQLLDRAVERLRTMTDVRLAAARPRGLARAEVAYRTAQSWAGAAARLQGRAVVPLPRLSDLAVGDQLAVTGHDLLEALEELEADQPAAQAPDADSALGSRTGYDDMSAALRQLFDAL